MDRALLIKTKNLGDAVVLLRAVERLRPDVEVDILCFSDCVEVFQMMPKVGMVYSVTRGLRGWGSINDHFRLLRKLRPKGYSYVVQFSDDWRGAFISRFLRPQFSAAYYTARRSNYWAKSFGVLGIRQANAHAIDQDSSLLELVGLTSGVVNPTSLISTYRHTLPRVSVTRLDRPYVIVQAASRWTFKQLEVDAYVSIVRGLSERGYRVLLTGSEADRAFNELITRQAAAQGVETAVTKSLQEFISLVVMSRAVVTIDSFALHVSDLFRKPTVAIFGPTNERIWGPRQPKSQVVTIGSHFMCRPCLRDGCDGSKKSLCLQEIKPGMVLNAFDKLMLGAQTR
jgi:heptosyltransferase-3